MNLEQRLSELEERVSHLEKEAAKATTASLVHQNKFYIVALKYKHLNYYLNRP
jgi:uncharacterized coiled-coil protein SlyX